MTQTEQIIQHARLVIDNHHDMGTEKIGEEFRAVRGIVLSLAGYTKDNDANWIDYIEGDVIPEELRGTLIALDDVLASHYTS